MKSNLLTLGVIALFLVGCSSSSNEVELNETDMLELINTTESELYSSKDKFDFGKAELLIKNYDQFAANFPENEQAAVFLFRAGDLCSGMNKSNQAISFFEKVYREHKDYEKAGDALFLIAFVQENQLKNLGSAEENYNKFIKEYPEHDLVSTAEFSIANLGKTPEDLIKEFERKADSSQAQQ